MHLILTKCAFGVNSRKFIKFIMHKKEINTSIKKVRVILEMHPLWSIREALQLTGWLTMLNQFLCCSDNMYLLFFRALKILKDSYGLMSAKMFLRS